MGSSREDVRTCQGLMHPGRESLLGGDGEEQGGVGEEQGGGQHLDGVTFRVEGVEGDSTTFESLAQVPRHL